MENKNKTKKKIFNIFEKNKLGRELNGVGSIAKTPNIDIQLTEKGTTSLKSEFFVDKIHHKSAAKDANNITKDFDETKLIYTPLKKKPKYSKSPNYIGKIDKYFINQSVKPPVEQSTNSLHTTMKNGGNKKPKGKKNNISNCLEKSSKVKLIKSPHSTEKNLNSSYLESPHSDNSIDNLIESIDTNAIYEMLYSRKLGNGTPVLQNDDSNSVSKLTPKRQDKIPKERQEALSARENNHSSQIKSKIDIPKIKQQVSDCRGLVLLKKKVKKAKMNTIQTMTNNSASSICDDKLKVFRIESDSYLSENVQETTKNITTEFLKETPKKRSRRPTICERKLDDEIESLEYREPKLKKVRRLTTGNTNMENITSTSKGIETVSGFNIENQNDLEKINEKTHRKKGIIKNNEISTEDTKIKQHVFENGSLVLLQKKVREANMNISQSMTNNTASSISDDKLNIHSITSDSYLSENLQETIKNVTSESVKETPMKRGRRPTTCKTKLDDEIESLEYREPKPKKVRRLTICNTNTENITSISKGIETVAECNIENQNDLEEMNEKTQLKKGIIKTNEISTDNTNIDSVINYNKFTTTDNKKSFSNLPEESQKTVENKKSESLRESARIKQRRLTISNISLTSNDFKETDIVDNKEVTSKINRKTTDSKAKEMETANYKESPKRRGRRRTICLDTLDASVLKPKETLDISDSIKTNRDNDFKETDIVDNKEVTSKKNRKPTDCKAKEIETANYRESPKKRGRRRTICLDTLDASVLEPMEILDISDSIKTNRDNDFKETDIVDNKEVTSEINRKPTDCKAKEIETANYRESPKKRGRRRTTCLDTFDASVLEPMEILDISNSIETNRDNQAPKSLKNVPKDNNENSAENESSSLVMINSINDETNTKLKEKQTFQDLKRKRGRPQSEKSICRATEVVDTTDNIKSPKKRGRRPTICKETLEKDVKTSEINRDKHVLKSITKISNDNSKISTENSSTNLSTNTELKEKQAAQEQKRKRGRPRSDKSVCKAKVVDTPDDKKSPKKRGRRPTVCKETSEAMETPENFSTVENNGDLQAEEKNNRPRSVKSVNTIVREPRKHQIRKINIAKQPKRTNVNLSKNKLNSVNIRRIPQDRLDEVLNMLEDEDHPIWNDRNVSCNAGIHHYWETRTMVSEQNVKMKLARQFLLRREWLSLAKILCLSNQDAKNNSYYPLLVKYATLCLAHTDKEQFNKFVKSLIKLGDDIDIIKKCTNISR